MGLKSFSSCCRQDPRPNLNSEVFSEHEMTVEGITLKERKEQSASLSDEEKKKLVLTHTRWIGNQSLIVHTVIDGIATNCNISSTHLRYDAFLKRQGQ